MSRAGRPLWARECTWERFVPRADSDSVVPRAPSCRWRGRSFYAVLDRCSYNERGVQTIASETQALAARVAAGIAKIRAHGSGSDVRDPRGRVSDPGLESRGRKKGFTSSEFGVEGGPVERERARSSIGRARDS